MKKKLSFIISLILVLCFPLAVVSANQETVSGSVTRGSESQAVSGNWIMKSSASNSDYCVNLLGCSAPGIPTNYVGANNLVFRPYTINNIEAANIVNFYNSYCDGNNRLYGSYIGGRGGNGSSFYLKKSLSSSSTSSSMDYTLRWNP